MCSGLLLPLVLHTLAQMCVRSVCVCCNWANEAAPVQRPSMTFPPTCTAHRGEIAQLLRTQQPLQARTFSSALSAFTTGRLILRFMHCIVSFAYSALTQYSPERLQQGGREGGKGGGNSLLSKGIDTLKYGLGKVSSTMRRVKILIGRPRSI